MGYLLGIDLGTTNVKALIIDEEGKLISEANKEYTISTPLPGYAEQDPDMWYKSLKECLRQVITDSRAETEEILSIGISGQMHGTVILGKDLTPLRPAIIWADKRSSSQCNKLREMLGRDKVINILGNPIMPGFMGPTLLWLKENEPSNFNAINKIMLPKDYVRFRLTGEIVTDFSDASATALFDIKKRKWSNEVVSILGISEDMLPRILESTSVGGFISREVAVETGLPEDIPVVVGGGDSQVGAIGAGVIKEGTVSSNIGTGGQIFTTIDRCVIDPKLRIHTFCHVIPGKWCLQGAILSAGLSLRWFRDNFAFLENIVSELCNINTYDLLSKEAEKAEPGCNGLVFLPYLLGERSPYMDPKARGAFVGITYDHKRCHFIRAIMEGVAFALKDCLMIFKELGIAPKEVIARGGGAKSFLWKKIQSNVFGLPVSSTNIQQDVAFGAALLAGVGSKVYRDIPEACQKTIRISDKIFPEENLKRVYNELYEKIYSRLYNALNVFWRMSD